MPATVRFDSSPALARAGRCQRARALRWRGWQPTDRTREEPRHRSRNRRLFAHSWSRKTQNHQRESKASPSAPRLPSDLAPPQRSQGRGGTRGQRTRAWRWTRATPRRISSPHGRVALKRRRRALIAYGASVASSAGVPPQARSVRCGPAGSGREWYMWLRTPLARVALDTSTAI